MAQHDYNIENQSGAAFRADLNNALLAIVSQNSGASEPSTTFAYQWWADTTTNLLKLRNAANSAWITLFQLDGEWSTIAVENGTAGAPSIYFKDSGTDTGFYSPGADQIAISTGGTGRLFIDSSGRLGLGTSDLTYGGQLTVRGATQTVASFMNSNFVAATSGTQLNVNAGATTGNTNFQLQVNSSGGLAFNDLCLQPSGGRVGIGTTSPFALLHVKADTNKNLIVQNGGADTIEVSNYNAGDGYREIAFGGSVLRFNTGAAGTGSSSERARIDSSGRLLVGTSSSRDNFYNTSGQDHRVQIEGTDYLTGSISSITNSNNALGSRHVFGKTRGTTIGSNTIVQSGDEIGSLVFQGNDGSEFVDACRISAEVDGTPGANDMPGRLVFSTTADGASSPTERMRITSSGAILTGKTSDDSSIAGSVLRSTGEIGAIASGVRPLFVNRLASDGALVELLQDTVVEGTISVSGTTVTYGGGHLARWSQLPNDEDPSGIFKGTVMSNLDEMCEWGEEDNEQLNKTKVSDIEGDPNVAGVFVSTSFDEDGPLDFFVAMTGDMIIRIAEGVTVQRGDLLMSAGDGTAKPQDDDIIRSKTIAKVTSTHVTCTYDDGSYCVPCVVMAC